MGCALVALGMFDALSFIYDNGRVHETTLINPTTGEAFDTVVSNDLAACDRAIDRAAAAFPSWRAVAPADRARLLRRFADLVDANVEELAGIEVNNAGHTIGNARWEASNVRDLLEYSAGGIERTVGQQIPVAGGMDVTFNEPLGVVGIIVPWNFPMPIAAWGFAPALAAGNTVVLKPAELTPLTAIRLGELGLEAGLPDGVFLVIPGEGPVVGQRFVTNDKVAKVCFTGSTRVGTAIMAGCAPQVKRVTLELGGKSANIVFADSDLERAAATAPYGVFDNAGQDCCARSRILVEASVFDRFMELLEPAVKGVVVGNPSHEATEMGPLISSEHRDKVMSYLDGANEVAFQGGEPGGNGFFFPPTVLLAKSPNDRVVTEEIFGPIVVVQRFADEAEAITMANTSSFALSGSIWTSNLARAIRVARSVEAGNLSVNSHSSVRYATPFGGMKRSGLGRELGPDAIKAFTETKNVFFATD